VQKRDLIMTAVYLQGLTRWCELLIDVQITISATLQAVAPVSLPIHKLPVAVATATQKGARSRVCKTVPGTG
jgi:hypothetical protein